MSKLIVSILENKIFSEILGEIKLFSKYQIKNYDNLNLLMEDNVNNNFIIFLFLNEKNNEICKKIIDLNIPLIAIHKNLKNKFFFNGNLVEQLAMPVKIIDLEQKITSIFAKSAFYKSSEINLRGYIINKNERKIKKGDIELQLTEKEINFLILFSKNKNPLTRDFVLKNAWHYSSESDTHTVETHIHRLRKKISEKFGDANFIKNNNKGYYI